VQTEEYRRLFAYEDRYWWFVARRRLALDWLARAAPGARRVLDLGCGTGALLGELGRGTIGYGVDRSEVALEYCRERGRRRLVLADAEALPFADRSLDAIVATDVIEHVAGDARAAAEARRVLRPGGVVILSVPAFAWLWGPHDVALMHHRRYRRAQVRALLEEAGFRVEKLSYSVFFLFPAVVAIRALDRLRKGEPEVRLPPVPGWLNRMLVALHALEARLAWRLPLPWGSSVVAVARRPE
jgi:Methylase involved in ubiquinone/menaquinone biosynthesis